MAVLRFLAAMALVFGTPFVAIHVLPGSSGDVVALAFWVWLLAGVEKVNAWLTSLADAALGGSLE